MLLWRGRGDGGLIVLGFGALSAWGAALAGLTDHKDVDPGDARNVATLHGLINLTATVLYTVAFFVRLAGGVTPGRWLALVGFVLVAAGVVHWRAPGLQVRSHGEPQRVHPRAQGEGVHRGPAGRRAGGGQRPRRPCWAPPRWSSCDVAISSRPCRRPARTRGGPLAEGALEGDAIVCPWHASAFRLRDGAVRHGPASTRLTTYAARINEGQVEVQGPTG